MKKWLTLVSLSSAAAIGFATGCRDRSSPDAELIRPVKTMVVGADDNVRLRTFPGTVEASRKAELAFRVPGILAELPVREGDRLKAGDLVARLREDEFQVRLDALQAQLEQARAELDALVQGERPEEIQRRESQVRAAESRLVKAKADVERRAPLVESRTVTRSEFERFEKLYQVAKEEHQAALRNLELGSFARQEDVAAKEAMIRGLEARVVEANLDLQDCRLIAPYDGVIAQRFVEAGQTLPAKTPVVRFQDAEELEVVVDVPEAVMAADIRTADILQMTAEFNGSPGVDFPVQLREISQVADPATQTFQVRVALLAPEGGSILPGMTAAVTVRYRRSALLGETILVPAAATLNRESGEQVVWIVRDDGSVESRRVSVGSIVGSSLEIVEGLSAGDRIAIAGATRLREGMQVRDLGDALGGGTR